MKDTSTTVAVVLYKSKVLSNGDHPLMLRVTKNRKVSYKAIGISCNPKYWDFETNRPRKNNPKRDLLESVISKKINEYNDRAIELKVHEREFTSATLIDKVEQNIRKVTVFSYFQEVIDRLVTSKQVGNANTYRDTLRSVKAFSKNRDFTFFELDYSFLIKYETYLRGNNLSDTSLSVYFRTLRALFNRAIKENAARLQDYPSRLFKFSSLTPPPGNELLARMISKRLKRLSCRKILCYTLPGIVSCSATMAAG